jgi:putative flippase GtrA
MTLGSTRIGAAIERRLQTTVGKRFGRFILVATGAVIASQVTLAVCLGPIGWTAGRSALTAWLAGAAVSYVLSRWAWERKGRPNLLKETLPFWIVAVGTAIVLTATTKWANKHAHAMDMSDTERLLFVGTAYFLANCVTFLSRFLIFHYILFRDRGSKVSELVSELPASERPGARSKSANGSQSNGQSTARDGVVASEPFAGAGSAAGVNGSSAWAGNGSSAWGGNVAERPPGPRSAGDDAPLPEPRTRR